MKGMIHLYTGNGKGKTTAAFGLAVRALMSGKKVAVLQFVKDMAYSETKLSDLIPGLYIKQLGNGCIFNREITDEDLQKAEEGLEVVQNILKSNKYDLVILDEICIALHLKLLKIADVLALLQSKPEETELILTGRYAPKELYQASDLVTEMKEIKHYYQQGITSRKGFDC